MIEENSIQTLKQRLDIVDVVGNYLELKRSGASLKAVCPFHDDTTPSLHVSSSKQIYHCFACGAGGDSIKFVMEYEKLSYPEAIEKLASMYNFSLTYTSTPSQNITQKPVLELLNNFFIKSLQQNEQAKNYLAQRGISEQSIQAFQIGYAPSSYESLQYLKANGINVQDGQKVGVLDIGQNGVYARFVQRITFSIYSPHGKMVGFGGRSITNHPAKYINSPQTYLFNKSRLLYGYHLAKQSILKTQCMIVTEGYLDVIMLHQAGFSNTVATLGTALTQDHLPLISRLGCKLILAYDGDEAGINAAFKASFMLSLHVIEGGVVIFNDNLDPADMVKNNQIQKLKQLFANPKPFVQFTLERIALKYNLFEPAQQQFALNECTQYLKSLPKIIASSYEGFLANILHVKQNLVHVKTQKQEYKKQNEKKFEDFVELSIIKTLLQTPYLIDTFLDTIDPRMFKTHFYELNLLLQNNLEHASLRRIIMWNDIKTFSEEELLKSLINIMILFYQQELIKIKQRKDLDYKHKSFYLNKIQNILFKLKKGELVPYESFGTI